MNSSLIQKLLFLHKKSSKPQEAKNKKIEISLENGKFDNFVDNGLEAGWGEEAWRNGASAQPETPGRILRTKPELLLLERNF